MAPSRQYQKGSEATIPNDRSCSANPWSESNRQPQHLKFSISSKPVRNTLFEPKNDVGFRCSVNLIRQSKCRQRIGYFPSEISASSSGNHNELLARRLAQVGDRSGVRACFQLAGPQFLSRSSIECAKTAIDRRPDEYHSAVRYNRPSKVRRSRWCLQFVYNPKRHFPNNLPRIYVHRDKCSPGRFLARPLVLIPEAGIFPFFGASPVSQWGISSLRFHCSNGAQFIYIDKQVPGSTIKRSAGPVRSTQRAGHH